jgi:hypothetical protein
MKRLCPDVVRPPPSPPGIAQDYMGTLHHTALCGGAEKHGAGVQLFGVGVCVCTSVCVCMSLCGCCRVYVCVCVYGYVLLSN